jgi:uncharacterized pyridoxamine 5'-phosphate oxidase family protein
MKADEYMAMHANETKTCFKCFKQAKEISIYARRTDYTVFNAIHDDGEIHYWSILNAREPSK